MITTELCIRADAVLEAPSVFGLDGQRDLHPPFAYKFDDLYLPINQPLYSADSDECQVTKTSM